MECEKLILTIRAVMLGEHVDLVAGDFNGGCVAVQQWKQHQCHRRSFCGLRFANAAGPYTLVGTRFDSKQLG